MSPSRVASAVLHRMRTFELPAALLLAAVSACSVSDPPEAFLGPEPPSIHVEPPYADPGINIPSFAYCWGTACVDGEPPYEEYRLELTGPGAVELQPIGLADWVYEGSAVAASDPTREAVPLEVTPANVELFSTRIRHLLVALPEAGEWNVTLSGRGPQGDAAYAFQVTVGAVPEGSNRSPLASCRGYQQHVGATDCSSDVIWPGRFAARYRSLVTAQRRPRAPVGSGEAR